MSESEVKRPVLYLFIGYPGAGKTTVAKIISEKTGAKHLWADVERHKLFEKPTHSLEESTELYDKLNQATDYMLAKGESVVFDTNFNYYQDREMLREIANKDNAKTVLLWINTPRNIAMDRAVHGHESRNLYAMTMTEDEFNSIADKLEPPKENEEAIIIDCSNIDQVHLITMLKEHSLL
jgi:predicted kinase